MIMVVVKLCIIFFVVAVQSEEGGGSKGPAVSSSPAFLPVIHPDLEGSSSPTNQDGLAISPSPATLPVDPSRSEAPFTFLPRNPSKTISPSTSEVPKEPFLHPPVTLPPTTSALTPHKGVEPSISPSLSPSIIALSPLHNAVPAPSTAQWNVPPTSAPTPHKTKVIEPSISPSPSPSTVALSPPHKDVPTPSIAQQNVPPTAAPIPQKIKGIDALSPSPSPNTITLSPPYKDVPAPSTAQGNIHTTSAPIPPNIKGNEPSVTPRPSPSPTTSSPLYKDVPAPSMAQGNVPATLAPTPPNIKGIEPSLTPRPSPNPNPITLSPVYKDVPAPSMVQGNVPTASAPTPTNIKGIEPSLTPRSSPSPITLSPLYKDVPAPSMAQGNAPTASAPTPPIIKGIEPSLTPRSSPSPITLSPLYKDVPAPSTAQWNVPPFVQPSPPQRKAPAVRSPESTPTDSAPVVIPSGNFSKASPIRQPSPGNKTLLPITPAPSNTQGNAPPSVQPIPPQRKSPAVLPPVSTPTASAPVAMPSGYSPETSPVSEPSTRTIITLPPPYEPILAPSIVQGNVPPSIQPSSSQRKAPSVWPPTSTQIAPAPATSTPAFPLIAPSVHTFIPAISPSKLPAPVVSPALTPSRKFNWKKGGEPVSPPLNKAPKPLPAVVHSPAQAPGVHKARQSLQAPKPLISPPESPIDKEDDVPEISPSTTFSKHDQTRNTSPAPASTYLISPPTSKHQDQPIPPPLQPSIGQNHHAPSPMDTGSSAPPFALPALPPASRVSPAPAPLFKIFPHHTKIPFHTHKVSPPRSSSTIPETPNLPHFQALPPPPPNEDCITTICSEPYTNSPPGAPCGCVWPMKVGLRFGVSLYTFLPLVSELASEIATGVFMMQSQVRIMGANIASQEPDKTVAFIDLVPVGEKFDNTTAAVTSERFWHKEVSIKASFFGDYDVLYVSYPGLPPSPPLPPSSIDGGPYSSDGNNGRTIKPLGVDIHKMQQHKVGLSKGIVAIIALSSFLAVVLCSAAVWALFKYRNHVSQATSTPRVLPPPLSNATGIAGSSAGDGFGSASSSFQSGIAAYTGSAKTFSLIEIEKATDNFQDSRILGEGGFGRVYSGILEDGTKVAVKVLKRVDHHGDREFLAEVEMLSRLHHRNLVKLIGICTEGSFRCLVYELIPNGSVESHLHGANTKNSRFDWSARLKIALGAARGLAYLHEDSSPPVIHRDFKSSNILLEDDFTPKVSDFGLARIASNGGNRHISTRVMGTFGYVAPEYAMTGHLLVKSDVYSYGVVVLELLTGRKSVDMSQPPGQENLVAWARPLLTSKEGLEAIIDPSLGTYVPFDSVAKVAAIASMCVQSDVSDRPFMGDVVQALKLICDECDEAKESGSKRSSQEYLTDADLNAVLGHQSDNFLHEFDIEKGLPASDLFSSSSRFGRQAYGSFRRQSYSGPVRTGRRSRRLWQIIRTLSGGSVSEHGYMFRL